MSSAKITLLTVVVLERFSSESTSESTANHKVAFTAKGQSPCASGKALEICEPGLRVLRKLLATNSGTIIDINAWDIALAGILPEDLLPNIFSLKSGFGVFGSNHLDLGYYVSDGRLDMTNPASSKLTFATDKIVIDDVVLANNRYTIGSQFLPGSFPAVDSLKELSHEQRSQKCSLLGRFAPITALLRLVCRRRGYCDDMDCRITTRIACHHDRHGLLR